MPDSAKARAKLKELNPDLEGALYKDGDLDNIHACCCMLFSYQCQSLSIEANRFYKYVQKIHTEYRAMKRGAPSCFLTEERIRQLGLIGFEFSDEVEKKVPEVAWSSRIKQLEAFRAKMGHLHVDS